MPQIAQLTETYSSQIFWLLVIFGLVFFVIGRGMVPKVTGTIAQRDDQIASDLAAAQAARDKADEEEQRWRDRENESRARAQDIVAKARADATEKTERRLAQAQERIDAHMAEAETRIAQSRGEAMTRVETIAAEAAQDIVRRLAHIDVAEREARAAVERAMAHG